MLLNPNVVVNAVVVKGGNGYNSYNGNFPEMILPLNNRGQLSNIGDWFVCHEIAQQQQQQPVARTP
jgi:hypothetical protein